MKVLLLTKQNPYSVRSGSSLRNLQTMDHFIPSDSLGLVYIHVDKEIQGWQIQDNEHPVLGITFFKDIAISPSLWRNFKHNIYNLLGFLFKSFSKKDALFYSKVERELTLIAEQFKPDVVIFSEIFLASYCGAFDSLPCKLIYDAHNAEAFLLKEVFNSQKSLKKSFTGIFNSIIHNYRFQLLKRLEQKLICQVDQVWVCSDQDANLLKHMSNGKGNFWVIPNGINCQNFDQVRWEREQNVQAEKTVKFKNVIYIGSYGYYPNQVAANFLITEIYPRLKQISLEFKLILVGSNPTETMLKAAKEDQNIIVTGAVEDTRDYLSTADVSVIPLFQGGGTRLKLLEAFAAGVPVISTSKGTEGIEVEDGVHLLIRENADEIIEAIIKIFEYPELADNLTQNAFKLIESRYSWNSISLLIDKAVNSLSFN